MNGVHPVDIGPLAVAPVDDDTGKRMPRGRGARDPATGASQQPLRHTRETARPGHDVGGGQRIFDESPIDLVADEVHRNARFQEVRAERPVGAIHTAVLVEPAGHDHPGAGLN